MPDRRNSKPYTYSPGMIPLLRRKPILLSITLLFLLFTLVSLLNSSQSPNSITRPFHKISIYTDRTNLHSKPPIYKINVYMYDLPSKFTHGVIQSYSASRGGDPKYPGNQHSAEWWIFDYLNHPDPDSSSPISRVSDPEQAELFYVPFFSSLSLIVNPIRPSVALSSPEYSDEAMQEELLDWLKGFGYWKRNNGWDHVFICQDPNALYRIMDRVRNGVLLVSDFGRLKSDQASLVKDVILPYSHRINRFNGEIGVRGRPSLLFFMGNRYRKEGGKIRDLLFQVLENESDVVIKHGTQSRESRRAATQGMHSSKFCLHPAGDTPSACRLFDAIVSLCVPVIVSDRIELPFEDAVDYTKIAIFVDSASAVKRGFLTKMLRQVSPERITEFQRELKATRHYFEYEDANGTVPEIWRQVSMKLPLIKLMINRDKRILKRVSTEPNCSCLCSNRTGPIATL